jgi:hypothetical protein
MIDDHQSILLNIPEQKKKWFDLLIPLKGWGGAIQTTDRLPAKQSWGNILFDLAQGAPRSLRLLS